MGVTSLLMDTGDKTFRIYCLAFGANFQSNR